MSAKQEDIIKMFDDIAPTYDKANRAISLGFDKAWRDDSCLDVLRLYGKKEIEMVVDIACGTGDMSHSWQVCSKKMGINVNKIVGIDPALKMIELAKDKYKSISFEVSTADNIPLDDSSVDIISISFGIRNVVHRKAALKEFYRVCKEGSLVAILEFTKDDGKSITKPFKEIYVKKILPIIGAFISKNKDAYKYLPSSVDEFITAQRLSNELINIGFKIEHVKEFSFGVATLIVARKGQNDNI